MKQAKDEKRVRRVFKYYRYIESDAFAQYLHEMSLKGWHLKEWKFWLEFEKGESRDIEYAVEVFPKGSEMDVKPGMDAEEYAEYCRAAGWELVDGRRRFCIFRRISEDAIPIVTEEERFRNIRKAEWGLCLTSLLTSVFIFGLSALQFSRAGFVFILFSNMLLLLSLTIAAVLVYEAVQCIHLAVWSIKAGREMKEGIRPSYRRRRGRYVLYGTAALILVELTVIWGTEDGESSVIVLWIFLGITAAVLAGIIFYRPARRENWGLQLAAGLAIGIIWCAGLGAGLTAGYRSRDDMLAVEKRLPLVMTDYSRAAGEVTFADYSGRASAFGSVITGAVEYGAPPEEEGGEKESGADSEWQRLSYTVYRTDIPWILDQVWKQEIKTGNLNDHDWIVEAGAGYDEWGAKEVMRREWEENSLYIRYADAVLVFYTTEPPEGEQIDIIREKLGL